MAFVHSKASRLLLNATHQTGSIAGYTVTGSRQLAECTTLLDEGTKYTPGLRAGSLAVQGRFDPTAGTLDQVFAATIGTDNGAVWTVCPAGYATVGDPCYITVTDPQGYAITSTTTDVVSMDLDCMPDDGVDRGVILHALGAETADANGSSVDNGASSANGGVAVLHVTAYSSLTSAVIKVQHSADNSSWSDLVTFTSVTATTYERPAPVTGTVNRYLRATVDVTGTGSVTYFVAFARR